MKPPWLRQNERKKMNQKISRQNLLQHELIGLPVKIARSLNATQLDADGEVIDETMKTLILGKGSARHMIPKTGTTFRFTLTDGSTADVNGELILRRPEDRVKFNVRRAS